LHQRRTGGKGGEVFLTKKRRGERGGARNGLEKKVVLRNGRLQVPFPLAKRRVARVRGYKDGGASV